MAWNPILTTKPKKPWEPIVTLGTRQQQNPLETLPPPSFQTKSSTQALPSAGSASPVWSFAKGVLQGTARNFAAFGAELAAVPGRLKDVSQGKMPAVPFGDTEFPRLKDGSKLAKFEDALFGPSEEPISFRSAGKLPGIPETGPVAPLVGAIFGGLDLTGAGGGLKGLKGLTTGLKAAKTAEEAATLLRSAGFVDDIIKDYAPLFAKSTDTKFIQDGLLAAEKLQNATVATRAAPEMARAASEVVTPTAARAAAMTADELVKTAPKVIPPAQSAKQTAQEATRLPGEIQPALKKSSLDAIDVAINTDRFVLPKVSKEFLTQAVEEIKPTVEALAGGTLSNKEVVRLANETSQATVRAIGREETLKFAAANLRNAQAIAAMAKEGKVTEAGLRALASDITIGENLGRLLQARSIKTIPKEQEAINNLLKAVLQVNGDMKAVLAAAEGVNFNDLRQATEFYRKFIAPNATEWIDLLRYNSMLSSPNTHFKNLFSNAINTAVIAPLEKALTGGVDFIGAKLGGYERTYFAGEGGASAKALLTSLRDATNNFADVMRGKRMYTNLDTKNIPVAVSGTKGKVASVLSYPTKLLEAADQFFLTIGTASEKAALEFRAQKGVPIKDLEGRAIAAAEKRLYRQKPLAEEQGYLLDAIDTLAVAIDKARQSKNPYLSWPAKVTFPFVQTPTNIFKQGIEYSPLGAATLAGAKNKTEQITKIAIGTAVMSGAALMVASNRATFGEPVDASGKQAFRAAKMQPYSVKIGDTWYSYQALPPAIAFPLSMVAALRETQQKGAIDDDTFDKVLTFVSKYGQFLADQSYAKQMGDLLSSIKGGENRFANLVSNNAQQFIPFRALGGWLARIADPIQRKVDQDGSLLEKQVQMLMMNIPGLSQKVPARLDAQGNPIEQPNRVRNAFSPVKTTDQSQAEFERYNNLLAYKKQKKADTEARSKELDRIQPIYDQAQAFKRAGDAAAAQALVDGLSEEDYELYKRVRQSDRQVNTTQLRLLLRTAPMDAVKFLRVQLPDEQQRLLDVMTDEEYQMYQDGKQALPPDVQASSGAAAKLLATLTGAGTAKAAAAPAPGSMISQPRSLVDKLLGRSEVARMPEGNAMGEKIMGTPVEKIAEGIANNETNIIKQNPYGFNKPSGSAILGRDLGRYQVTEYFLKKYSPRYLGRVVSPEEFLKSPELQDEFMKNRIQYLLDKGYTPQQIADIHRHGSTNEPGSTEYNRPEYVKKFNDFINA